MNQRPDALRVAGGALLGLAAALALIPLFDFPYRPFDGTIGPPAFFDFNPRTKVIGYMLIVLLPILGGWVAGRLESLDFFARRPRSCALAVLVLGFAALRLGAMALPAPMRSALGAARGDAVFCIQAAAIAAVVAWFALSGRRDWRAARLDLTGPWRVATDLAVISLHLYVIFQPLIQEVATSAPLALVLGAVLVVCRRGGRRSVGDVGSESRPTQVVGSESRPTGGLSTLEMIAWSALALVAPATLALQFGRAVGWSWLHPAVIWVAAGVTILGAGAASFARSRLGSAARVGPLLLLPFAVATLYRGAGAPYAGYDPYHQGEFIYAPKALAAGLAPFRDIFFVHGLGYNTLPGAAAGPWLDRFPNADVMMMTLLSTLGVGLTAWFCLRLWGARWWPAALAVAALAAGVDTIKGPRYLPLFMMLLIIVRHMETGRARWMVLAGATAAASVFFSLDVGGIALAAGAIWSALRPVERRLGRLLWSSRELRAFLAGAAAIGGAAALWLWSADLLGEFIDLHLQYARVKQHYDSLPLPTEGLAFLLSPALSVVAGLVLLGLAREDPPLDDAERRLVGAISLLMLLNLAAFLRGLDRSDEGHLVYASILAWPLAGTLLVFRAHRARIGGVWARAVALAAMAAMIPFCHPAIRGRGPALTLNVRDLFVWHARNSGLRVLVPVDRMETSFFDFRRELEAATGPNQGLLDLTNRPALYAWTSLEAPSRFFATFYASSRRWQDETIRAMESKATPWALWADRNADLRRIDGIDVQLRHWALARHVWRNYTPHLSLSDGSLLLRRRDEAPIGPPQAWTIPPPIETLDLGAAPLTWGAWPARSPREPDGELWIVDSHDASSGPLRVPPEIVERLPAAEELQVTVLSVRSGRIHVSARGPNGWPGARFSFEVQSRFVGPYRIPLSSFAAWVGGGPIEEIAIAGEGLESLGPVNLRFLVEPNGL